jgi:hypothetical protein
MARNDDTPSENDGKPAAPTSDPPKTHRWVKAFDGLLAQRHLKGTDKIVYQVLTRRCWRGKEAGWSRATRLDTEDLASAAGVSERGVRDVVARLVAWGLVEREREGAEQYRYKVIDPLCERFWRDGQVVQLTAEESAKITSNKSGKKNARVANPSTLEDPADNPEAPADDDHDDPHRVEDSSTQGGKAFHPEVEELASQGGNSFHPDQTVDSSLDGLAASPHDPIPDQSPGPHRSPTEGLAAGGASGFAGAHPNRSSPPPKAAEDPGGLRPPRPPAAAGLVGSSDPDGQDEGLGLRQWFGISRSGLPRSRRWRSRHSDKRNCSWRRAWFAVQRRARRLGRPTSS